ncbi:acyl--CoA ligase [Psychrobium sp. MM17-31]|uniref:AMP-binding protein n=1 Tax=Psychrobium sp. MM17-31 TaxID=2917758 RepID=UPI001EF53833|nr:class I adenylate-forming enzyme family protein [Psychrobium sp. MM17-31]MCG7531153.1 acyl--CoA ligase [Psychrobium sp. MM17-31]
MPHKLIELIDLIPSDRSFIVSHKKNVNYGQLKELINRFSSLYSFLENARCAIRADVNSSLALYLPCVDSLASAIFLQPANLSQEAIDNFYLAASIEYLVDISDDNIVVTSIEHKETIHKEHEGWLLATSGTTGSPKLASYKLASLLSTCKADLKVGKEYVWGVCYDINRFAGLQVYLQGISSGSCLVIPDGIDSPNSYIELFSSNSVNAMSGTPSFWRKLLMSPACSLLPLKRITLGGEISDQTILNALKRQYQHATIVHIYASTEAGVGFSVKDGKAGFPIAYLSNDNHLSLSLKVKGDNLWIKTARGSKTLLVGELEVDELGYIDTGDVVKIKDNRVIFCGRKNGSINVGGSKVIPEEIEAVLNLFEHISLSRVFGKKSAVLGTLVCAEIVVNETAKSLDNKELKSQILRHCREHLEAYKVPALIKNVDVINTNESGKIARN